MARTKEKESTSVGNLKEETKHGVIAIVLFAFSLFFILSAWGKAGPVGHFVYKVFEYLLGLGYGLLPLTLFLLGFLLYRSISPSFVAVKIGGALLFILSTLGVISMSAGPSSGGLLGKLISSPLVYLFDVAGAALFLSAFLIISLFLLLDRKIAFPEWNLTLPSLFSKKEDNSIRVPVEETSEEEVPEEEEEEDENEDDEEEEVKEKDPKIVSFETGRGKKASSDDDAPLSVRHVRNIIYTPPPLSLLMRDKGKPDTGDIKANANIIKRTLQNFGISVEMDEITIGPSVTRYSMKPAEGVKLSRILALQNDIGLALAAHPIRIEAPIPGKSLVGIEVPNSARSTIGLGGLIGSDEFKASDAPLLFAIGKGVSGQSVFGNLAKLPHGLIAGATGSGKSVTIHAVITSLLYRNSPENLRFIMIDPKRVELTLYNNIPHLLTPVITDAKKAILSLKWAAKEMDRRYDVLQKESVRDISSYHKTVVAPAYKKVKDTGAEDKDLPDPMPYIVIVIDELADIMATYPRELESAIVRLAQMSRAVGIHLLLSTQRPSVNVITGLIKANVPGRIALQVASQVDSRTILDMAGAEKLLGSGDMLYISGEMSQPSRIQSAFVSESEVKSVVKFLKDEYEGELGEEINLTGEEKNSLFDIINASSGTNDEDDDDLYEEARQTVMEAGKASTSYLQRKLKVGYARAARLMDILEERGVIGPGDGAKPREVLMRSDGFGKTEEEN